MNRNQPTRPVAVPRPAAAAPPPPPPAPAPARPARATARRTSGPRYQPKKKSVVGRIVFWLFLLGLPGLVVASFFVKAEDGRSYADLYVKPAWRWAKEKISPPEVENARTEAAPAAPSELDVKFDEAVAARAKADSAALPEGADEAIAALEKELESVAARLETLREVAVAAAGPKPRKTRVDVAAAVDELAAQAKSERKFSALLAERKSARDVKAALAAVPPPPPPPPPVVPYDLRKFHDWPERPVGSWVRWKTVSEGAETIQDGVLAAVTGDAALIRVERVPGGAVEDVRALVFAAGRDRVVGEEALAVGDAQVPCRIVQSGATRRWIVKEGPGADRVALKTQTGEEIQAATGYSEEEIPVKGETRKCVKVESGNESVWGHPDVPGFAVRRKVGDVLAEVVDWGADASVRPAPPAPPKPAAAAVDPTRPHPWASFKPGAWARRKTAYDSPTAKTEASADAVLVEVGGDHALQRIETLGPDGRLLSLEKRLPLAPEESRPAGEETLKLGEAEIPCAIEESDGDHGRQKAWFAKEGALARLRVPLKVQAQRLEKAATQVSERTMPIGGRPVKGLRIVYTGRTEDGAFREDLTVSEDVPGFEVLRETTVQTPLGPATTTFTLIDFGSDPSRKTSLALVVEDAAQAEDRRVRKLLADAEQLTIEGGAQLREVIEAMKDPPLVPERLRALLAKAESASALLVQAREGYVSAKEKSSDPAPIEERLSKLDRALEIAGRHAASIRSRLK